jgi:hypothetical protein
MAYIGKQPVVGNFQKCDAISVVNGQAAYSLTVGSAAVTPENANHMLVSLNGVLQAPGDSFTVSGSTLTFASNLATGDVIDFVIILGDVLDLGTPSDNSVSTAKLVANSVTAAKFNADVISGQTALAETPADTDELLLSDAGVLKRVDFSHLKGGGMYEFISQTTVSSNTTNVDITSLSSSFEDFLFSIQGLKLENDGEKLYMQLEQGGSFLTAGSYTFGGQGFGDSNGSQTLDSGGASYIELQPNIGNASQESYCAEVILYNAQSTSLDPVVTFKGGAVDTNRKIGSFVGAGSVKSVGAITGVRFSAVNGDIASAKIAVYGRKRA